MVTAFADIFLPVQPEIWREDRPDARRGHPLQSDALARVIAKRVEQVECLGYDAGHDARLDIRTLPEKAVSYGIDNLHRLRCNPANPDQLARAANGFETAAALLIAASDRLAIERQKLAVAASDQADDPFGCAA